MHFVVVCALFVAAASANPLQLYAAGPLYNQYHSQDNLGQYSYGYNGGLSSKTETKTLDGVTRGSYSYVDSNGILQTTEYTADAVNGFRAAATNLPKAPLDLNTIPEQIRETPEVAQARADHLKAFNEVASRPEDAQPIQFKAIQPRIVTPLAAAPLLSPAPLVALGPAPGAFAYSYNAPAFAYYNTPAAFAYRNLHPVAAAAPQYIYNPQFFGITRAADTIPNNNEQISDTEEVIAARAEHFAAVEEQKAKIRAASEQ